MSRRSRSSGRWLKEHFSDPFVLKAREAGYRSRAVFKLEEIDRRERLLRHGQVVLDLGAAPGAWSQYARQRIGAAGRLIATDLLPLEPLPGVEFVQGDFREPEVHERLRALLPAHGVDVLLSDMAPNLAGVDAIDQPRAAYLGELALAMAAELLKGGGTALIKVFQGAGFEELRRAARDQFSKVKLVKPEASRSRSAEMYLLAMQFRLV